MLDPADQDIDLILHDLRVVVKDHNWDKGQADRKNNKQPQQAAIALAWKL